MVFQLRRFRFLTLCLLFGGGLCLLASGTACLMGNSSMAVAIGWASLISLLCFLPSYYVLVWAFGTSGQATLAALCLGLPVRFGVALGALFVLDKSAMVQVNPTGLWLCVFYTLFLILESVCLAQEPVSRPMAPANLKEGR